MRMKGGRPIPPRETARQRWLEELAAFLTPHHAHAASRVRAFYGERLRHDADEIAYHLLRLELRRR